MTPTHSIFRQTLIECKKIGDAYDYLPVGSTSYPFIYTGEMINTDTSHGDLVGTMNQTVHLYGRLGDRKTLMEYETKLHDTFKRMRHAFGYNFSMIDYTTRMIPDNTDVQPLLHVVMDVSFMYTKGEQLNG